MGTFRIEKNEEKMKKRRRKENMTKKYKGVIRIEKNK